jgi:RecA/RadA recombinase
MPDDDQLEYINMPEWWVKGTGTKGLPFRRLVMIAGDSDSGKTSASIAAIKAAQEQGVTVLYVETEGKTTKKDFTDWGVDPAKKLFIMQATVAEEIYDDTRNWLKERPATEKILIVIDSVGNVLSKHDMDRDLADTSGRPGGKGKTNREGLAMLVAKSKYQDIALLIINYTYENIGSPGKTNAGGKAVNFFSSLTYQTSRKGWLEKTVKGEKVRIGAKVKWNLFKNHISRSNMGPKSIELDITAEGIKLAEATNE